MTDRPNLTTQLAMLEVEISDLIIDVERRGATIAALEAENDRLRAALQIIADGDDGMDSYTARGMQNTAHEALTAST